MYTCEEHGRGCVVVYDTGRCPFCDTIKERDEAVNERDILVDEVRALNDRITELENG